MLDCVCVVHFVLDIYVRACIRHLFLLCGSAADPPTRPGTQLYRFENNIVNYGRPLNSLLVSRPSESKSRHHYSFHQVALPPERATDAWFIVGLAQLLANDFVPGRAVTRRVSMLRGSRVLLLWLCCVGKCLHDLDLLL